ncbi:MAG: BON domain-containing protein [Bdellovibrionales bacterium]|nr:BON domain-containing protein [Bdellovibrionales bacterium]
MRAQSGKRNKRDYRQSRDEDDYALRINDEFDSSDEMLSADFDSEFAPADLRTRGSYGDDFNRGLRDFDETATERRSRGHRWQANENWTPTPTNYEGRETRQASTMEKVGRFFGIGPKGWKRSDSSILEDVCEALARDGEVNAAHIEVKVDDGIVTLSGSVESRKMKRQAESCADDISGVQDVNNNLRVDSTLGTSPYAREETKSAKPRKTH